MAAIPAHLTRRTLLAAAGSLPLARAAAAAPAQPWTRDAFEEAMRKSGRPIDLSESQFAAIQARKPAALKRIESYLKDRLGSADPAVMKAFEVLPARVLPLQLCRPPRLVRRSL